MTCSASTGREAPRPTVRVRPWGMLAWSVLGLGVIAAAVLGW